MYPADAVTEDDCCVCVCVCVAAGDDKSSSDERVNECVCVSVWMTGGKVKRGYPAAAATLYSATAGV